MSKAVGPDLRKYMDKKLSGTPAILILFVTYVNQRPQLS